MLAQIKSFFNQHHELPAPLATIAEEQIIEEFVSFPCECGESVRVRSRLMPGEAVVLNCDNCELSWTVYNPSLIISKTKEIPETIQKRVWGELSA